MVKGGCLLMVLLLLTLNDEQVNSTYINHFLFSTINPKMETPFQIGRKQLKNQMEGKISRHFQICNFKIHLTKRLLHQTAEESTGNYSIMLSRDNF